MRIRWWYPLWLRKLVCAVFGHKPIEAAIFQVAHARVGRGCQRCLTGEVREYRCQYPVPR